MPVMTAEAMMAQARMLQGNPGGMLPPPLPRRRDQKNPNPTTAGGPGGNKARMDYYIPGPAEPIFKRPAKPLPKKPVGTALPAGLSASSSKLNEPLEDGATNFTEYDLAPRVPDDAKFQIMNFKPANMDHKVDITGFNLPFKLNRKNPKSMIYAEKGPSEAAVVNLVPMRGPDGNPVYHNGQMVMVGPDGQTTISAAKAKDRAKVKGKGKAPEGAAPEKKRPFMKKKTKQTFKASDEVRARRKEEYLPWLLEEESPKGSQDTPDKEEWVGTMNGVNDDGIYAVFRIDKDTGRFELVPAHRYYDFKPKKQIVARVRAEDAHERFTTGKRFDMTAAFAARNHGQVSEATKKTQAKVEKMELDELKPLIKPERGGDDDDLFGDGGGKQEMEGDMDEMEFEEEMADDEEDNRHEEMAEDEEEKRTQDRLKREWIAANKAGSLAVDDSDDDLDLSGVPNLNDDGKRVMKTLVKNEGYEEDSDSEEEDDYSKRYGVKQEKKDEDEIMTMATGVQEQKKVQKPGPPPQAGAKPSPPPGPTPNASASTSTTNVKRGSTPVAPPTPTPTSSLNPPPSSVPPPKSRPAGPSGSRAASPAAPSGAAMIAMRATSPKRTNTALSRATSPTGSRAGSPLAGDASRATSPPASSVQSVSQANAATSNAKKRKDQPSPTSPSPSAPMAATTPAGPSGSGSGTGSSVPPVHKKKKADSNVPLPTASDVIEFIRSKGGSVTAADLAARFKTKGNLTVKNTLVGLVKQVAKMDNGMVVVPMA